MFGFILLQDLTKQLDEVTQNSEIVEIRQKEAECELEAARDRVQQQATEILLKASKAVCTSFPLLSFSLLLIYSPRKCVHPCYTQDASLVCCVRTHQTYSQNRSPNLVGEIIASNTLMA